MSEENWDNETLVRLLQIEPGFAVVEFPEYEITLKIKEDDWWLMSEDGCRYIGGVNYFCDVANLVWLVLKYNADYLLDEDMVRRVYTIVKDSEKPEHARAWLCLLERAIKRAGYDLDKADAEEDYIIEEAIEAAQEYLERWARGEASLLS